MTSSTTPDRPDRSSSPSAIGRSPHGKVDGHTRRILPSPGASTPVARSRRRCRGASTPSLRSQRAHAPSGIRPSADDCARPVEALPRIARLWALRRGCARQTECGAFRHACGRDGLWLLTPKPAKGGICTGTAWSQEAYGRSQRPGTCVGHGSSDGFRRLPRVPDRLRLQKRPPPPARSSRRHAGLPTPLGCPA